MKSSQFTTRETLFKKRLHHQKMSADSIIKLETKVELETLLSFSLLVQKIKLPYGFLNSLLK